MWSTMACLSWEWGSCSEGSVGDMRGYVTVEDFARRGNIGRQLGDFKKRNNAMVSLKDYCFDIQALNVILSS